MTLAKRKEGFWNPAAYSNRSAALSAQYALRIVNTSRARQTLRQHMEEVLSLCASFLVIPSRLGTDLLAAHRKCIDDGWHFDGELAAATTSEALIEYILNAESGDDPDAVRLMEQLWRKAPADVIRMFKVSLRVALDELARTEANATVERNLAFLDELLDLNANEQAILRLAALSAENGDLNRLCGRMSVRDKVEGCILLSQLAGSDGVGTQAVLAPSGRLIQMGILEPEYCWSSLSDMLVFGGRFKSALLTVHESLDSLVRQFLKPSAAGHLDEADYPHLTIDRGNLTNLLKGALQHQHRGVNVLLYGPPGTGKTQFAKLLAKAIGASLFDVESAGEDGLSDDASKRITFLFLAQRFLKARTNSVLMFDEAEDAFPPPRDSGFFWSGPRAGTAVTAQNKAWINQFLETNATPVIWISNHIEQMDEAYLRRFTYHLEISGPPKSVRRAIAHKHLDALGISENVIHALAEPANVSPAQIEVAARGALLAADANVGMREDFLLRQVRAGCRAMGLSEPRFHAAESTHYDPGYLNLNSTYSVEKIASALKRRGVGTLCFYGRSGTGKTALGRYLATALDRELIVKSASSVLSMWVGGTEKNIASMFREAEDSGAVLLLDEADTLMRDRTRAERSWEASQVNEFLARIEEFLGIFICTTNLYRDLDQALLRRFTFKIEFLPMTPEQRLRMVAQEFGKSVPDVSALNGLTPGDVANVKRQRDLMAGSSSASELLDLLAAEVAAREGEGARRQIGFV